MATPTAGPSNRSWRQFALAAVLVFAASAGFVAWLGFKIGGDQATTAVDDIGEAVAAGIAALSCGLAARRTRLRLRRAWTLLAASAASWCAGEIAWSVYEVGMGVAVPFPSVADVGFLGAIPLAIAGILSFTHTSRGTSTGLRLWFDRAIVATSLVFVAWELGLGQIIVAPDESLFVRLVSVAYPVGDILIGTVLILAIRRATDETQGRLGLLLAGLAANAIADSAFAYLNASGDYGVIGSELDSGWVIGYLVIALAATWPSDARDRTMEEKPVDVWQLILPWVVIGVGGGLAVLQALRGQPLDIFATMIAAAVIGLVMVSQVLAQHDSLTLVYQSRLAAATLNQMIVSAPLGVVRIGPDMTVVQANPTFAAILHDSEQELNGASLNRFVRDEDVTKVIESLTNIRAAEAARADFETRSPRRDGTQVWLHWTATAVAKTSGDLDYFLVMFEDVSARRAADEVAAANLDVLERLNRLKSEFMTKVRHEFRTALVGIEGFSEYIRDSEQLDPDEVRAMAGDIEAEAHHLDQTIQEMVRLDTARPGPSTLAIQELDLAALLREAAGLVQMGSADHSIVVDVGTLPAVMGDRDMLPLVITGLLGRAIDYSPPGGKVTLSATTAGAAVQVSVFDLGVAAAADLDAQLIGKVNATPSRSSVRALTSDVGLPMARQIVEMHGGRIWFETGSGTVWKFTIPIGARPAAKGSAVRPPMPSAAS